MNSKSSSHQGFKYRFKTEEIPKLNEQMIKEEHNRIVNNSVFKLLPIGQRSKPRVSVAKIRKSGTNSKH